MEEEEEEEEEEEDEELFLRCRNIGTTVFERLQISVFALALREVRCVCYASRMFALDLSRIAPPFFNNLVKTIFSPVHGPVMPQTRH